MPNQYIDTESQVTVTGCTKSLLSSDTGTTFTFTQSLYHT